MARERRTLDPNDLATSRTQSAVVMQHNSFYIGNTQADFDYGFVRKADIENGSAVERGWEPITEGNHAGEVFSGASWAKQRTLAARKSKAIEDVVACKRPIEAKRYFEEVENTKYNRFISHIKSVSKRTNAKFRNLGEGAACQDESSYSGSAVKERPMTQIKGPSVENDLINNEDPLKD